MGADYQQKKTFFAKVITVYGRKPVLEALQDQRLECYRLHLADSNKPAAILDDITALAQQRGVDIRVHNKRELSRVSRNGKQDQGVAADILCPAFHSLDDYLANPPATAGRRLLALDGITNPQNIGMILRSAVAGGIAGILWPQKGNAELGPLVVKASAGTLYRAPIIRCGELGEALQRCRGANYRVAVLDAAAPTSIYAEKSAGNTIYVLGNESSGVSAQVAAQADTALSIPMCNGVESLNVAVSAALIAYLDR